MAIIQSGFTVVLYGNLCLVLISSTNPSSSVTGSSSNRPPAGRVWEGPGGALSMTWKQLVASTNTSHQVINLLTEHTDLWSSLEETHRRPFPWTAHIRTGNLFLPATIIRAKPDEEKTDMAITTAETCNIIKMNTHLMMKLTGRLNAVAVFGAYHREDSGCLTVPVVASFPYPDYTYAFRYLVNRHDICIVRLEKAISFSDNLKPARLPAVDHLIQPGTQVTVSGWDQDSGKAVTVHLRVADYPWCEETFMARPDPFSYFCIDISDNDVTTSFTDQNETRPYTVFDTGAPVLVESNGAFVMLGIITLSEKQSDGWNPKLPAVVVRMSYGPYQDWMEEIIKGKSALWKKIRRP